MRNPAVALMLFAVLAACQPSGTTGADEDAARLSAQAAAERATLEALAAQVAADREAVAGFQVLHVGYGYGPDPRTGQPVPTVRVALANGSPVTVARVSLQVRLANEGQSLPWLDQAFDVPLANPLAAGADGEVSMSPSGDSDWALKAPPDGVPVRVRVLPLALQTADGRKLLTEHALSQEQRQRLEALRAGSP